MNISPNLSVSRARNFLANVLFGHYPYVLKTSVSTLLVYWLCERLGASQLDRSWAVLTVLVVMDPRLGATIKASINRLVGTFVGAVLAASLLHFIPANNEFYVYVGLFVISIIGARICAWKMTLRIAAVTAVVIYVVSVGVRDPWQLSIERFIYIAIGIIVPYFVSLLVLPMRSTDQLTIMLAGMFSKNRQLLQDFLSNFLTESPSKEMIAAQLDNLKKDMFEARTLLAEIDIERWQGVNKKQLDSLNTFVESEAHIYHSLRAIEKILEQIKNRDIMQVLATELRILVNEISEHLIDLSMYIHTPVRPPLTHTLESSVANIDEQLQKMRKMSAFSHYDNNSVLGLFAFLFELKAIAQELIMVRDNIGQ